MIDVKRLLGLLLLLCVGLSAISARCIENDSLRRDTQGDWYISGEIHNETEIQGLDMILVGRLEFADGTVLEQRGFMCPPGTLSPGTFSVFTIRFPETRTLPRPVRHSVNVTSGRASDKPLRKLLGQFAEVNSSRPAPGASTVSTMATFEVEAREPAIRDDAGEVFYNACIVLYSPDGDVVRFGDTTTSSVPPGAPSLVVQSDFFGVSADAVEARVFFYLLNAGGEPLTAPRISDPVPIIDPTQ